MAATLRQRITSPELLVAPGVYDLVSLRLANTFGFEALYMTGYTRNAIVHQGRVDPGVALLGKPFTYDQLAAKVRACLDEEG